MTRSYVPWLAVAIAVFMASFVLSTTGVEEPWNTTVPAAIGTVAVLAIIVLLALEVRRDRN